MSYQQITYEEWLDRFKPIQNHLDPNACHEGMMFETYGEELDFVRSQIDKNLVWTLIEGDDGMTISSGYHYVNRMGYFVVSEWTNPKIFWEVLDEY